jgi:hypothetical protein
MKALVLGVMVAVAWTVSTPGIAAAKGGGGGHAGGHSSGGHASGGHSSGGHASGGHTSGGHTSGGHAQQGSGSHGTVARATSSAAPQVSANDAARARPRDGRPSVGTAVPRTSVPSALLVPSRIWPYATGGGLSVGYFYDPFAWNAPWWSSGLAPYGVAPFGFAPDPFDTQGPAGGLRLVVEPRDAEVFVDGYYAGIVDSFNGHFQHLDLPVGSHHVEVRAAGYAPLILDVSIQAHHKTVYRGALMRAQP